MEQQKITKPELTVPQFIVNASAALLLKGLEVNGLFGSVSKELSNAAESLKKLVNKGDAAH
jgi:hypothetical protein